MNSTLLMIHSACTVQAGIETPLGRMHLARTPRGLAGAWFDDQRHHPGALAARDDAADALLCDAADQLQRYFSSGLTRFTVPLDLLGTPFQRSVWQALLEIDYGATRRYGDIAERIGAPAAARAVGAAVGRNPVSILVPCHRVLGSGGALTGYAGGLARKVALLELESLPPPGPPRTLAASAPRRGAQATSLAAAPGAA